jgi:TPP-dependent pyruvate/acetoin dehydrogenase alpha subunit
MEEHLTLETLKETTEKMALSKEEAANLLLQLCQIRAFEEQAERSYMQGKIHGTMHLSIGQEAAAVGSISVLEPDDYILSTHRGHGHCIAKGADLNLMMAEFYGKETGYCRGRGGSMHIADVEGGNLGANGVVGGGVPMAVGVGLGLKMQKTDRIILGFFGDGAASGGAFHESMEMAVLYQVRTVFVCENNQYAMSFPARKWTTSERLAAFADCYGLPGVAVDGNDLLAVREAVKEAVDRARSGGGPSLVVCNTYRWRGHSKSDRNLYRTDDEIKEWQEKDPVVRFRRYVVDEGLLGEDEADEIKDQAYADIEAARVYAENSPEPDIATIEEGVYAP